MRLRGNLLAESVPQIEEGKTAQQHQTCPEKIRMGVKFGRRSAGTSWNMARWLKKRRESVSQSDRVVAKSTIRRKFFMKKNNTARVRQPEP